MYVQYVIHVLMYSCMLKKYLDRLRVNNSMRCDYYVSNYVDCTLNIIMQH